MSKTRSRVKSRNQNKPQISQSKVIEIDYPIFCFKHLVLNCNGEYEFYYRFIERISKLSGLTWSQINLEHRHGYGHEKMPIKQIKPSIPNFITPDVENLTVFRANSDKRPFLGIRRGNVFHIIFMEEKFGDVYNH